MNELTFEFVQDGEFYDPYYNVIADEEVNGTIEYDVDEWVLVNIYYDYRFNSIEFIAIAKKLEQLNESTRKQRIFNWF